MRVNIPFLIISLLFGLLIGYGLMSVHDVKWIPIVSASLCTIALTMSTSVNVSPGESLGLLVKLCFAVLFVILLVTNIFLVVYKVDSLPFIMINGALSLIGALITYGVYSTNVK